MVVEIVFDRIANVWILTILLLFLFIPKGFWDVLRRTNVTEWNSGQFNTIVVW